MLVDSREGPEFEADDPRKLRCAAALAPACLPVCCQIVQPSVPAPAPPSLCAPHSPPHRLCVCRRLLDQRLTLNAELRAHFVAGLKEQMEDAAVLHAALKPMAVTGVSPAASPPACLLLKARKAEAVSGGGGSMLLCCCHSSH